MVAAANGTNSLDLSEKLFSTGDYLIKVRAEGDSDLYYSSNYSAVYTYTHKKVLATPANLTVTLSDDGVIASWDEVTYAYGYELFIDGGEAIAVSGNSKNISEYISDVKNYSVEVRATTYGNFTASEKAAVTYAKTAKIEKPILTITGSTLSWEGLVGANKYTVKIGSELLNGESDGTPIDLAVALAAKPAGEYVIYVQANKNGNYNASDIASISYVKQVKLATPELSIVDTTVNWAAVDNAVNYTVYVGDTLVSNTFTGLTFDVTDYVGEAGEYAVSVSANAIGHYLKSDAATVTYTALGKLGKTDLSANGLTVEWTAVLGANKYAVTVDGEKVAETTLLEYDLSDELTQNKVYTVGVYAIGYDSYNSADESTMEIIGVAPSVEMKTYEVLAYTYTYNASDIVYLDGVKTDYKIGSDYTLTIPASAQKLIVVSVPESIDVESKLYSEVNLTTVNENNEILFDSVNVSSCETSGINDDQIILSYVIFGDEDTKYYYLESKNSKTPIEVAQ